MSAAAEKETKAAAHKVYASRGKPQITNGYRFHGLRATGSWVSSIRPPAGTLAAGSKRATSSTALAQPSTPRPPCRRSLPRRPFPARPANPGAGREHPVADVLKRLRGELEVETEPELVAASMVRANIERILGNPPRDESIPWPPLPSWRP